MIVSGSPSQWVAAALAEALDEPLAPLDHRRFPDGELLVGAPGFEGDRAVVVCSTVSPEDHLELLQLQDAVREAGATEVVTVLPYMGYARQDRPVAPGAPPGESPSGYPLSARAVARAISTGTDRVLTVTPHEESVCEYFDPPAEAVDVADRLADPLPSGLEAPVFVAPDDGAVGLARTVRDAYGGGTVTAFEKTRRSGSEVEVRAGATTVDGRDVVLVDDIVATGSTMSESVEILDDRGAGRVFVTCVHPMLVDGAYNRLVRAGVAEVYGTDTVERPVSVVSVAPTLAEAVGHD